MSTRTRNVPPSAIARTIAEANWPMVQHQYKLARGVYGFSCAGHGGVIAILSEADLPAHAIDAARQVGLIELVAVVDEGYRTRRYTSVKYTAASLRELAERSSRVQLFECWVGEEDCDWATIALVSPAVREGMARNGCSRVSEQDALECCEHWCERFLMALDPTRDPIPDGQVARADWVHAIHEAGGVTLRAAWGDFAEGVPKDHVRVLFAGKDGREEAWIMHQDVYRARPALRDPLNATPVEFEQFGPIRLESSKP